GQVPDASIVAYVATTTGGKAQSLVPAGSAASASLRIATILLPSAGLFTTSAMASLSRSACHVRTPLIIACTASRYRSGLPVALEITTRSASRCRHLCGRLPEGAVSVVRQQQQVAPAAAGCASR